MSEKGSAGFAAGLKRLTKHSGVYALGAAINKVTGFLLIPLVTAYIGTRTNYGVKEIAEVTLVISGQLLGINLLHGMVRYYSEYEGPDRDRLVSTCMILLGGTTGLALGVTILFADPLAVLLFGSADYADALLAIAAILFFQTLGQVGLRTLQILERSGTYVTITLVKLFLEIGLKVFFLVSLSMTYMGVILPVLVGEALLGGGTLVFLLWRYRAAWSNEMARRLVRYSGPLVLSGLCMFVLHQADRFFLKEYDGLDAVGLYGLAYKLGYMVNALIFESFALIWYPFVFGLGDDERVRFTLRKVLSYFTFGVVLASLGLALFSFEVVHVMAAPEFREAYRAIPPVVLGYVFWAVYQILSTALYLKERTGLVSALMLISALLNVALNALWVPEHGIAGAAWATVATFGFLALATWIVAERVFPVRYELVRVLLPVGLGLALYGLAAFVVPDGSLAWNLGAKAVLCAAFPAVLLAGGYFTAEERTRALGAVRRRLRRPSDD